MVSKSILIPIPMVMSCLEGALDAGHDIKPLLEKCDLSPDVISDPEARISVDQFAQLSRYTKELMNDEMYGLTARPIPIGALDVVSLTMVHAKTVGDALKRFLDFNKLFENSLIYDLVSKGNQTELIIHRRENWKVLNSFAIESSLSFPHRFLGWLANERIVLNQLLFDYSPPAYSSEYKQIFYCAPCLFNQKKISLQFDNVYLDHPIVQTEASLSQYMRRLPLDHFLRLDAGGKTTLAVRKCINPILHSTGVLPDFDDLAERMGLHPHTLRRQLQSEGTHYSAIKTQVRRDIATQLLGLGHLSVADIAYETGYTEPGAFIRAFKSWTGLTPLNFRQGCHDTSLINH
jgi:AraC-like DNA-binding protein